jgi:hypothetical protein
MESEIEPKPSVISRTPATKRATNETIRTIEHLNLINNNRTTSFEIANTAKGISKIVLGYYQCKQIHQ